MRRHVIQYSKSFNHEEFWKSEYAEKIHSHFGMDHYKKRNEERWGKYEPTYYIVPELDEYSYNLGFFVYMVYTIQEGLTFFKEMNVTSSAITSAGLERVLHDEKDRTFIGTGDCYEKSTKNRRLIAKHHPDWILS